MSSSFDKVKSWIISSGLYINELNNENYGAVHSYYDIKSQEYGFLYPEITGYFLSVIRFLYQFEKNKDYLKMAESSANWLIGIYDKYGGIIMGIDADTSKRKSAFSFDTAICAKGLIDCYLITKKEIYLAHAESLVNWLLNGAIEQDGTVKPYKNLETQDFMNTGDVWYRKKGCLHIKTAIPLFQLYQLRNRSELLEAADKISNAYTRFHKSDGSFSLHENSDVVNLHTQCYAMEGLLYAFSMTKNEVYLESCKKAIEWSIKKIENDGSIRLWHGVRYQSKASYPIAQLVRLMILIDSFEKNSKYKSQIDKLHSFLLTMQVLDGDKKTSGGFIEEIYKSFTGWKKKQRLISWGSMFALQCLKWYDMSNELNFNSSIEFIY
ncbi:MAG: hypothetical protein AUH84_01630 [Thaumarchaeota archaeon 13_1_40CM_4_38_7]|nr:MAG: hypothetical protein AUH84_01630 [Thaumarchaeota archaeon 13_1_40CM_4_38_7]